ncbi:hypothetical protein EIN_505160 [Entamoeba invadens IP1]|uniref:Uncharacterized protein n=1 Tax=Entamoeba invadens IP1 TaxID=370355 RepID=A0A0A1UAW0_ENTIV|nr:hypothetical protein EIN_505160 [Entamoeba invadens IP1]ELP90310.1 hypothetical protein EIN_505160 [Entamoeba invadens IP1]|eukprot:XP_004257081.1 hypothetical protein EIN_505160 [Entamoeba invadens IP1]
MQRNSFSQLMSTLKHVLLGNLGVGKTCIAQRYALNQFLPNSPPTLCADFCTKRVQIAKVDVELNIWDTAGSERFRSMISMYYRGAKSCMIVYDITSKESFCSVEEWYNLLKDNIEDVNKTVVMIVGTKTDLEDKREVSVDEGVKLSQKLECLFMEVTSKEGESLLLK